MTPFLIIFGSLAGLFILIALFQSIRIVPAKTTLIVERLGKYKKTLMAGFHVLVPFIEKVSYRHNLKEQAVDVPSQAAFTLDNVRVEVDGVLYFQVIDPKKASYGIKNYKYGTIQLAQTTMRSVIGKLQLDKTFEERDSINAAVVKAVDDASDEWGVNVTRYEVQNIKVPNDILEAMEAQVKAERQKRAIIAKSEGEMESTINSSLAQLEEMVNRSEGEKQKRINEAEGKASEIAALASATAESIRAISASLEKSGGDDAAVLQLTEQFLSELQHISKGNTEIILPMNMADMKGIFSNIKGLLSS